LTIEIGEANFGSSSAGSLKCTGPMIDWP
jgi:hypothetical protein